MSEFLFLGNPVPEEKPPSALPEGYRALLRHYGPGTFLDNYILRGSSDACRLGEETPDYFDPELSRLRVFAQDSGGNLFCSGDDERVLLVQPDGTRFADALVLGVPIEGWPAYVLGQNATRWGVPFFVPQGSLSRLTYWKALSDEEYPRAHSNVVHELPTRQLLLLGQSRLSSRTLTHFTSVAQGLLVSVQTRSPDIPGGSSFDTTIAIHQDGSRWDSVLLELFEAAGWLVEP